MTAKIIQFPQFPQGTKDSKGTKGTKDSRGSKGNPLPPTSDAPCTLIVPEFTEIPIDTMLFMCGWVLINMRDGNYVEIADNLLEDFMDARDSGSSSGTHPVSTKFVQNVFARAMVESDLRFASTIDKLEQYKKAGLFKD